MTDDVVIVTTAIDPDRADALARDLVEQRLAACAQVTAPIRSTYWWQGEVEQASEVFVICKSTRGGTAALITEIERQHPYDVPEIVVTPVVAGNAAYLAWVRDQVDDRSA